MLPGSSFFLARDPSGIFGIESFMVPEDGPLLLDMSYLGGSLLAMQMLLTRALTPSSKLPCVFMGADPSLNRSGLTYMTSATLLVAVMMIPRTISHMEQLL